MDALIFVEAVFLAVLVLFTLRGTKGYIVGKVKRFDEREQVFLRGYLAPGSEQYRAFYSEHPQWEEQDGERRREWSSKSLPDV